MAVVCFQNWKSIYTSAVNSGI